MNEGVTKEDIVHDAEVIGEVKNNTENISEDFISDVEVISESKNEAELAAELLDREKVSVISNDIKETMNSFEAGESAAKKEETKITTNTTEDLPKQEIKKKESLWKMTKNLLYGGVKLGGFIAGGGASIFKRVGNFYQKMKSFFTGKPVPQSKK